MRKIDNFEKYIDIISNSNLFVNIPIESYEEVFSYLHASFYQFKKGEYIQRLGEPLHYSGIVLAGTVEGSFISESYDKINMNHFPVGRSFGDALASIKTDYSPIQLRALTDCTVILLKPSQITSDDTFDIKLQQILSRNLINQLASQNVFSNLKLRIVSQKALRDRVLMYLYSLVPDSDEFLHVPFNQTALAEFLGVNRSALSRELGRMQDEELIIVDGKKIKLTIEMD